MPKRILLITIIFLLAAGCASMGPQPTTSTPQEVIVKVEASKPAQVNVGTGERINKSMEVLREWLKVNSGDVAAQFGITVQALEGVIPEYQRAFTTGVSQVLWVGAAVVAVGAVLAWFTFGKREE